MEGGSMKIKLVKNNRYWDPKTKTHLTRTSRTKEFTDKEVEELSMDNIEYAIKVGILEIEGEVEELDIEEEIQEQDEEEEEVEVKEVEEEIEEDKNTCNGLTSSGNTCSNTATWPEDDPEYCHIKAHQKHHDNYEDLIEEEEDEEDDSADINEFEDDNFNY